MWRLSQKIKEKHRLASLEYFKTHSAHTKGLTWKWSKKSRKNICGIKNHMYGVKPHNYRGGYPSCDICNKKLGNYKAKRCLSCAKKNENNPNWRGGITPKNIKIINRIRNSIQYKLWRNAVLARDGWVCKKCLKYYEILHAHHIKPFSKYPELRFAINNGITLCKNCHKHIKHYEFISKHI